MEAILNLDAAWRAGTEQVGGKGGNLSRLARYGFPVPRGGVLLADIYRQLIAESDIASRVAALASVSAEAADLPETDAALVSIRKALLAAELPTAARSAVAALLDSEGLSDLPVAVRSSATAEDGARTSFAGIHESRLNVVGLDGVLRAVLECYASLWTPRALAYRRRFGLRDDEVACAVVICAMVQGPDGPPTAAGVAFSCDPVTGQRDVVRLSAVRGLGDALVSGAVNPEDWTLTYDRFRAVAEQRSGPLVLTVDQASQLAILVGRVHWALGDGQEPQDVEWAYDGQRYWLLQARPVTRVPRHVPPGAEHLPIIWSNANLKDVLPGVPTVMTWESTQSVVRLILLVNLEASGYPVPRGMEVLRRIDGRAYFDLTMLQWAYYDALALHPRDMNASFGGRQPEIPLPQGNPTSGPQGRRRRLAVPRLMRALWQNTRSLPEAMRRLRALTRDLAARPLGDLTGRQLISLLHDLSDVSVPFSRQFQLANGSTLWYGMLAGALERLRPGQSWPLMSALMAGGGAVVSANHGYRITDLARAAEGDVQARSWIESDARDPAGWRTLPAASPFRQALEQFLHEFGHRGVYELELANPRWNEDPSYIVDQVQHALKHGIPGVPQATARERRRRAEAEVDGLPWLSRPLIRWLAERARLASAQREESKSVLVSVLEPMRAVALETGRRLAREAKLARPEDVFHLTWLDVGAYLYGDWDGRGADELVQDRRAQRAAWLQLRPPDLFILDQEGRPANLPSEVPPSEAQEPSREGAGDRLLRGVPAAAGRASGPARVIMHPEEGHRLQPGDVLVAPSTDPGWTPLFLRASAIVMEVGGYVSHGAIVAREYGIPAVVNVPDVLQRVRDGQTLEVDGDAGTVALVE